MPGQGGVPQRPRGLRGAAVQRPAAQDEPERTLDRSRCEPVREDQQPYRDPACDRLGRGRRSRAAITRATRSGASTGGGGATFRPVWLAAVDQIGVSTAPGSTVHTETPRMPARRSSARSPADSVRTADLDMQ